MHYAVEIHRKTMNYISNMYSDVLEKIENVVLEASSNGHMKVDISKCIKHLNTEQCDQIFSYLHDRGYGYTYLSEDDFKKYYECVISW